MEKTTFSSYTQMVKGKIAPYFRNTGLTLDGIQAKHIQSFYLHELKTVSPGTVIHYHANIHKALKCAVKMDLIPFNPADKVERPKKQRYIADYYRQEELERLLEASKDHPYSLLIQMTAFYGLRRSEALGLKWDTITIKHIVTNAKIDGKCEIVCADRAKTKSSLRSLPLVSNIREKLLALREQQKENRRVCGNCYSKSMTAMFLWMPWAISSTPEALPPISASCWSRTVCGTFAFTTSDTAAPHCFWRMMCL